MLLPPGFAVRLSQATAFVFGNEAHPKRRQLRSQVTAYTRTGVLMNR